MREEREEKHRRVERERLFFRYSLALGRGDFEIMTEVLRVAERDLLLERMILELHAEEMAAEEGAAEQGHAVTVRELLRTFVPSGFAHEAELEDLPPLTVSDVIGRLQSDAELKAALAREEKAALQHLRQSDLPLPQDLSQRGVHRLFEQIGLSLSAGFRKLFRETAIFLSMGREQQSGLLAAARRQRRAQSRGTGEEKERES